MATSRIKNLIIYILLFVNLFLIGLLASDWLQTRRAERTAMEAVQSVLADSGITMECGLPDNSELKSYTVSRDLTREEEVVSGILGDLTLQEQQDGSTIYYRGEKGEAIFRGSGYFEVLLENWAVPIKGDTVDTAQSVLRKMGIKGEFLPEASTRSGGIYTTVVMACTYEGVPVENARIEFGFTSDFLMMVSGTRVLDVQREDPSFQPLDEITMLTRFLGIINRNGYVCSELRDISPVYLAPDVSGGKLVPVWRIEMDAGTFYLNMTTGEEQLIT